MKTLILWTALAVALLLQWLPRKGNSVEENQRNSTVSVETQNAESGRFGTLSELKELLFGPESREDESSQKKQ